MIMGTRKNWRSPLRPRYNPGTSAQDSNTSSIDQFLRDRFEEKITTPTKIPPFVQPEPEEEAKVSSKAVLDITGPVKKTQISMKSL